MLPVIFHKLLLPEEAVAKVEKILSNGPFLGTEKVSLSQALNRVLWKSFTATVDSPPFDRSEVDGFAVLAKSTYGAEEDKPIQLKIVGQAIVGLLPICEVLEGEAVEIATGAPIPRGANSVVMVEYTKTRQDTVTMYRSVVPGENLAQTGSDVMIGDLTLRQGAFLSPREIAVLAALGLSEVEVYRSPKVAVFSTGDELVSPGEKLEPGKVFDINGVAIHSLLTDLNVPADNLGILGDDYAKIKGALDSALERYDVILTSGSTSAGLGDIVYKILEELGKPGMIVHGLRIKPGKPTVAAIVRNKLIIGLPGFPVSAMIAFSVFAKPILANMMGRQDSFPTVTVPARMAFRVQAGKGKREYIPVNVIRSANSFVAYPLLGGSGSVSTLAMGDGYVEVGENREYISQDELVEVKMFTSKIPLAELDIIGSHCPAIDLILELSKQTHAKIVNVGSMGGWEAVRRGEADIAGTHLLDEETHDYNVPFFKNFKLAEKAVLIRGYCRAQGFVVAKGNPKGISDFAQFFRPDIVMINRNAGSGTRAFIDYNLKILRKESPFDIRGYDHEAKTHSAVAAAVSHGRADVGVAVETYSALYGLDFIPLGEEQFDFLIQSDRLQKNAVKSFLEMLRSTRFAEELTKRLPGYRTLPETGTEISP